MKIIYHHRTEADGAEGIHIREMIGAFRQNGNEVELCSITDRSERYRTGNSGNKPMVLKSRIPSFIYEFCEVGYNVVGTAILMAGIAKKRPDFLYERYSLFNLSAGIAGRIMRIPIVLEVNAPLALERSTQPDEKLVFRKVGGWFEGEAFRMASGIVAVSSPLRDYIVSLGIPSRKILVLPNGVDDSRFKPKERNRKWVERYGIPSGKTIIGFSGIFRSWHGIEALIEAFATISRQSGNVHLLLVGDGPMRQTIEEHLSAAGLGGMSTITGRIPHMEMPDVTSLMDIAVSPRATFYASPMKIIEYMALGIAVVAPDTGNIRDIITDGSDGILFDTGSPDGLVSAIMMLLKNDSLREGISRNARATVETRLNWRSNARAVTEWVRSEGWKSA